MAQPQYPRTNAYVLKKQTDMIMLYRPVRLQTHYKTGLSQTEKSETEVA